MQWGRPDSKVQQERKDLKVSQGQRGRLAQRVLRGNQAPKDYRDCGEFLVPPEQSAQSVRLAFREFLVPPVQQVQPEKWGLAACRA